MKWPQLALSLSLTAVSVALASAQGSVVKGKQVYEKAIPKCSLCHVIGASGGKFGPDLSDVGTRRDTAWLTKYLPNPQLFDSKNKMPAVSVKGQELADLVAYLRSLKGKPKGS